MLTTLNIDLDIPSNCMYDLESLKHKAKEYLNILIQPAPVKEEVDYEAEMLNRKVKKLTVEELKARIDESMNDIAEGRVYSEEEAWKIMDAI